MARVWSSGLQRLATDVIFVRQVALGVKLQPLHGGVDFAVTNLPGVSYCSTRCAVTATVLLCASVHYENAGVDPFNKLKSNLNEL